MKKFIVIGLGNFGFPIAKTLMENNCEVLGLDTNRELVQKYKDLISHAVIGDASRKEVLESLSLKDFDGAVVSIGQDMGSSILITLYLKEIGLPRIIVRATSEDHGKILKLLGVSDVVFPERDMAVRAGSMLAMKNIMDYLPLAGDYGIVEMSPPKTFVGKSLKELQISTRYGCQIIGLKFPSPPGGEQGEHDSDTGSMIVPTATDIIAENCIMVVMGKHRDIEKLQLLS